MSELTTETKQFNGSLSATVEPLARPFVQTKKIAPLSRQEKADAICAVWNAVADEHGSFADEYRAF